MADPHQRNGVETATVTFQKLTEDLGQTRSFTATDHNTFSSKELHANATRSPLPLCSSPGHGATRLPRAESRLRASAESPEKELIQNCKKLCILLEISGQLHSDEDLRGTSAVSDLPGESRHIPASVSLIC